MKNNLCKIRTGKGISISELSRRSSISRMTIYKVEAGDLRVMLFTLVKLSEALGCSVTDLIREEG